MQDHSRDDLSDRCCLNRSRRSGRRGTGVVGAALVVLSLAPPACSPYQRPPETAREASFDDSGLSFPTPSMELKDATLGPGDEIRVQVFRHPELSKDLRIPPSGRVFLPLAGELDVLGISGWELRGAVTAALDRYLVDPQVSVEVVQSRSRKVVVLGEVRSPGLYALASGMTVIEMLASAGGLTRDASETKVFLHRLESEGPVQRVLDLEGLFARGNFESNPLLEPGDILYFPPSALAEVDRFARHLSTWINPVLQGVSAGVIGYDLYDNITDGVDVETRTTIVTNP